MSTEIQVIRETEALIILEKPLLPKAMKKLEGSKQVNQEVLRKEKRKWRELVEPHMGHCKLTAWLPTFPLLERWLPHLLWASTF